MTANRGESSISVDQLPCWNDVEAFPTPPDLLTTSSHGDVDGDFADPLLSPTRPSTPPKFPVDSELNSKLYIWLGDSWLLCVDAVVNSSNETLDIEGYSPLLHAAAGPRLAEECANLGGCRVGMAQITGAYELPARKVIHTVGPKYVEKYHTAVENALSHCYESCLELLIEHDLHSAAFGCVYTEDKGYPRDKAAHVALCTVRRFLEQHRGKINAIVLCLSSDIDITIYERLLLIYFPRNKIEENYALQNVQMDIGDENGGIDVSERKIRIKALPGISSQAGTVNSSCSDDKMEQLSHVRKPSSEISSMDSSFLVMTEDPDRTREEQWKKASKMDHGWSWSKWLSHRREHGGLDTSIHNRFLARAKAVDLSGIAEMKILYRGGVDKNGHSIMIVIGAHFLLRCLGLEQFLLYVVKEFEPIMNRPYSVVYFHSAAALQFVPDMQWMKQVHRVLGPKHKANLHKIYMVHPTLGLRTNVLLLRTFVEAEVWAKVVYVYKLSELFKHVAEDQLRIPDFIFQHDIDIEL